MQATKTTDFSKKTAYLATGGSGLRTEKIVRPQVAVNEEGGQSKVVIDYDIKTSLRCSGCRQREEVIRKQMAIIEECKILIRNQQEEIRKLGGEPLPLPEFLKQAFS